MELLTLLPDSVVAAGLVGQLVAFWHFASTVKAELAELRGIVEELRRRRD